MLVPPCQDGDNSLASYVNRKIKTRSSGVGMVLRNGHPVSVFFFFLLLHSCGASEA